MLSSSVGHSKTFSSSSFVDSPFVDFTLGFLLTVGRKTVPAVAKSMDTSSSTAYRILHEQLSYLLSLPIDSFKYIQPFSHEGWLAIDDTFITKQFSEQIQGTSEIFDPINKKSCIGFSKVVLVWTNGNETIPLMGADWFNKDVVTEGEYKKKEELAVELLLSVPSYIKHKGLIFDGLYATKAMLSFFVQKDIRFVGRFASNRVVSHNGVKCAVRNHPDLKIRKNEHSRTIKGEWHGLTLYFTQEKRKDNDGKITYVFLVSNFPASSKEYVAIYKSRWGVEMFFRTAKQSLGLKDCQSTSIDMQKARVNIIFYIYTFLQHEKKLLKAPNVESVLHSFLQLKKEDLSKKLHAFNHIFHQNG